MLKSLFLFGKVQQRLLLALRGPMVFFFNNFFRFKRFRNVERELPGIVVDKLYKLRKMSTNILDAVSNDVAYYWLPMAGV